MGAGIERPLAMKGRWIGAGPWAVLPLLFPPLQEEISPGFASQPCATSSGICRAKQC